MIAQPNSTTVLGRVAGVKPDPSGRGSLISIDIERIEGAGDGGGAAAKPDFIRPRAGQPLEVYCARPDAGVAPNDRVRARLTLLGGPFGSRIVSESIAREE